jgi:hypothetical protein
MVLNRAGTMSESGALMATHDDLKKLSAFVRVFGAVVLAIAQAVLGGLLLLWLLIHKRH